MNHFPSAVRLRFHGDLVFFLKTKPRDGIVVRQVSERTSIKDVIEACGVPHPEVDVIVINGRPVNFAYVLVGETDVDVYSVQSSPDLFPEQRLQRRGLTSFIGDGHLGKLTRDLRLLGFDVLYDRDAHDRQLLALQAIDRRALLTRDRRLLMHSIVQSGYYLRSQQPLEQTVEIVRRFDLFDSIEPFTRCLRCNATLREVEKNAVIDKLEPLTKIYYHKFRRCTGCGQLYWAGSHFGKLQKRIDEIQNRFRQ